FVSRAERTPCPKPQPEDGHTANEYEKCIYSGVGDLHWKPVHQASALDLASKNRLWREHPFRDEIVRGRLARHRCGGRRASGCAIHGNFYSLRFTASPCHLQGHL